MLTRDMKRKMGMMTTGCGIIVIGAHAGARGSVAFMKSPESPIPFNLGIYLKSYY